MSLGEEGAENARRLRRQRTFPHAGPARPLPHLAAQRHNARGLSAPLQLLQASGRASDQVRNSSSTLHPVHPLLIRFRNLRSSACFEDTATPSAPLSFYQARKPSQP